VVIMPAARHRSLEATTHIESAYAWSRQPKRLPGDELGFELSLPDQTKQASEHTRGNV
jgi:hypothetical protein